MAKTVLTILVIWSALLKPVFAREGVAKVIVQRNQAEGSLNGKTFSVKKGDWLKEGTVITTHPKSFVKLLFIDKSSVNIGPKSQMKITAFPKDIKKKAGIITLIKGQIRSKVTKNYFKVEGKKKSKLFIKTKTAAMGVRGTDFQVNFNSVNQATSLITFSGAVAMAQINPQIDLPQVDQSQMEKWVSSPQAVTVRRGQYSGASPQTTRATTPVKISPVQLEVLQKNDIPGGANSNQSNQESSQNSRPKKFKSIIPPGADSKAFANQNQEAEAAVKSAVGTQVMQEVKSEIQKEEAEVAGNEPPPEGAVNTATGEIAPTAGGYIDPATAQYIPPPPGSVFDPNAGVYIPPPEVGYIDPETGAYKNDAYDLTPEGKFVPKEQPRVATKAAPGRGPASVSEAGPNDKTPPPPPEVGPLPTLADPSEIIGEREEPLLDDEKAVANILDKVTEEVAEDLQERQENPTRPTETRVKLRFTIN